MVECLTKKLVRMKKIIDVTKSVIVPKQGYPELHKLLDLYVILSFLLNMKLSNMYVGAIKLK